MKDLRFELSPQNRNVPVFLILLGALAAVYGIATDPGRAWPDLLLNGFYITSIAVSALFFMASQRVASARWSANLRRIPEAFTLAMPVCAVLMLALYFGRQWLYSWSRPGAFDHAPSIAGKVQYLQTPWVFARMAIALLLWTVFAFLFRRASLAQDRNVRASLEYHRRMVRYSAGFIVVFAFSFTLGAYDWIISLDPSWFSTMFGVYVFAGAFVQGIAAITLATVLLRERGPLRAAVSEHQLHDLGKLLFAFSTFWAYIWTCQYLLIWYGNIPEEVGHYVTRTNGPWLYLFALNFVMNWLVPFFVLLAARAKRNPRVLGGMCVLLLAGHWLDLYMLVMPALWTRPRLGLLDILIAAGYAGLLYALFVRRLAAAPLIPVHDPVLAAEAFPHAVHEKFVHHWVSGVKQ